MRRRRLVFCCSVRKEQISLFGSFYVFSPVGELRAKSLLSGDSDSAWIQAYTTSGDIDNDGDLDLFLWGDQAAGDTMQGHLIRNEGKGKLVASSSEPEGFWPVRISDAI